MKVYQTSFSPDIEFDLLICAVGYESRSTYVSKLIKGSTGRRFAIGFSNYQTLHYAENRQWYDSNGFYVYECSDRFFKDYIFHKIYQLFQRVLVSPARILFDISSLSRIRIALALEAFYEVSRYFPIDVRFLYSIGKFQTPPTDDSIIATAGPVTPFFSGWTTEPDRPLVLVVGLGYEPDRVLGVVEYTEASRVSIWKPVGIEPEFGAELVRSNQGVRGIFFQTEYLISQTFDTFLSLESHCSGIARESRIVVVPFGPKIFALQSMLVALHHRDISVWRVSGGDYTICRDTIAYECNPFCLGVIWEPSI